MAEAVEYKVLWIEARGEVEILEHLNEQGEDGWVLASLVPTPRRKKDTFLVAFYRAKS